MCSCACSRVPSCGWIDSRREPDDARRVGVGVGCASSIRACFRRARAARSLLVVDAVLGVAMALLVLAQAVLLARVAARAFEGASLEEVATPLVLLVAVVVARALGGVGLRGRRDGAQPAT